MKITRVFLIVIVLMITSCSDPLDTSIFEKLSIKDLKNSIERDTLFKSTYKDVELARDSILKTELEKVKYFDLTYNRFYKYIKFTNDTTVFKPLFFRCGSEWETKYGYYIAKVDSISDYWKNYKAENSLDSYVKVELVEIDKEYYSYTSGLKNVNLGFKLTPLKGKIDQLTFFYSYKAKIYDSEEKDSYLSRLSILDRNKCLSSSPITKPTVKYWQASYTDRDLLGSNTHSTFLRDYNLNIEIDQIRKDGVNISSKDSDIPESVTNLWKYGNDNMKDFYIADVVKEVYKKDYLRKFEYYMLKRDSIIKNNDPLSYELDKMIYKYKYEKK